jgi:hypothetical protein
MASWHRSHVDDPSGSACQSARHFVGLRANQDRVMWEPGLGASNDFQTTFLDDLGGKRG